MVIFRYLMFESNNKQSYHCIYRCLMLVNELKLGSYFHKDVMVNVECSTYLIYICILHIYSNLKVLLF